MEDDEQTRVYKVALTTTNGAVFTGYFVGQSNGRIVLKKVSTDGAKLYGPQYFYASDVAKLKIVEEAEEVDSSSPTKKEHRAEALDQLSSGVKAHGKDRLSKKEDKDPENNEDPVYVGDVDYIERNNYVYFRRFCDKFFESIVHIMNQETVGVSFEGVDIGRDGILSLVQVSTENCVFAFDIIQLGSQAFSEGLKDLFETTDILKVIHDCRWISDMLCEQYKIQLVNVFDAQVANVFIYKNLHNGFLPKYVESLPVCLIKHLNLETEDVYFRLKEDTDEWLRRPFLEKELLAVRLNASYLPKLYRVLLSKMLCEFKIGVGLYLNHVRNLNGDIQNCRLNGFRVPSSFYLIPRIVRGDMNRRNNYGDRRGNFNREGPPFDRPGLTSVDQPPQQRDNTVQREELKINERAELFRLAISTSDQSQGSAAQVTTSNGRAELLRSPSSTERPYKYERRELVRRPPSYLNQFKLLAKSLTDNNENEQPTAQDLATEIEQPTAPDLATSEAKEPDNLKDVGDRQNIGTSTVKSEVSPHLQEICEKLELLQSAPSSANCLKEEITLADNINQVEQLPPPLFSNSSDVATLIGSDETSSYSAVSSEEMKQDVETKSSKMPEEVLNLMPTSDLKQQEGLHPDKDRADAHVSTEKAEQGEKSNEIEKVDVVPSSMGESTSFVSQMSADKTELLSHVPPPTEMTRKVARLIDNCEEPALYKEQPQITSATDSLKLAEITKEDIEKAALLKLLARSVSSESGDLLKELTRLTVDNQKEIHDVMEKGVASSSIVKNLIYPEVTKERTQLKDYSEGAEQLGHARKDSGREPASLGVRPPFPAPVARDHVQEMFKNSADGLDSYSGPLQSGRGKEDVILSRSLMNIEHGNDIERYLASTSRDKPREFITQMKSNNERAEHVYSQVSRANSDHVMTASGDYMYDRRQYTNSDSRQPYEDLDSRRSYRNSDFRQQNTNSDSRHQYSNVDNRRPYQSSDSRRPYQSYDSRRQYMDSDYRRPSQDWNNSYSSRNNRSEGYRRAAERTNFHEVSFTSGDYLDRSRTSFDRPHTVDERDMANLLLHCETKLMRAESLDNLSLIPAGFGDVTALTKSFDLDDSPTKELESPYSNSLIDEDLSCIPMQRRQASGPSQKASCESVEADRTVPNLASLSIGNELNLENLSQTQLLQLLEKVSLSSGAGVKKKLLPSKSPQQ